MISIMKKLFILFICFSFFSLNFVYSADNFIEIVGNDGNTYKFKIVENKHFISETEQSTENRIEENNTNKIMKSIENEVPAPLKKKDSFLKKTAIGSAKTVGYIVGLPVALALIPVAIGIIAINTPILYYSSPSPSGYNEKRMETPPKLDLSEFQQQKQILEK